MNQSDVEWVEATFGVTFSVWDTDLRPDITVVDRTFPGAWDLAHVLAGDDNPREILGAIDDVMAARAPRLAAAGTRPVLLERNGEYYLHLDYSKVVIGPEEFEIWSLSAIDTGQVVKRGMTEDLKRLVALWADYNDQKRPAHEAFDRGARPQNGS